MAIGENESLKGSKIDVDIRSALREELRKREMVSGERVVEEEKKEKIPLLERDILWRLRMIGLRQVNSFTRELSILLEAGMPLLHALQSLTKRAGNQKFRHIIRRISIMVENGEAFWKALANFPHVFSRLYVNVVKAGEISGQLQSVLKTLANFGEREYMLRRRARGALIYPAVVGVLAVVVIVILSTFLVPVFADLFTEFDAELPFLTRMLIASRKFSPHFWLMVVFIIAVLFGVYKLFTRTIGGKLLRDRLKLKLPIIGPIHLRIVSSRFARTFATLINSGVPILDSLSIARDAAGNEVVALDLDLIRNGVEKGQTLETSLRESTSFPPLLMDMVTVGEQAGNLGEVLTYTANIYDEEVNSILSNLITIIEPFLVLGMGILVALVLYSFFIPYIDLLTAVGQL